MSPTRPRVFIARPIQAQIIQRVAQVCEVCVHPEDAAMAQDDFANAIKDMEGVISVGGNVSEAVVEGATRLKVLANIGAGYDTIDVPACTRRRIAVTNTPDVLTESTADFAFALLLGVSRRLMAADRYVRDREWKSGLFDLLWGTELAGKALGIYGFGQIGQAMARRGRGFGMRILYHSRRRVAQAIEAETSAEFVDLADLLKASDFISLHAPLNSESTHAIGMPQLKLVKPTAFLVNTARGKIIDEDALVLALQEKRLAGAGLDVFADEPRVHPALLEMKNVLLAPHIASATSEARMRMASLAADNLLAALAGSRPPNLLNPDAFTAGKSPDPGI